MHAQPSVNDQGTRINAPRQPTVRELNGKADRHVTAKERGADAAVMQELRPGQFIELLAGTATSGTREGKLNQDSRRKLKQVYHLFNFIEPLLQNFSVVGRSLNVGGPWSGNDPGVHSVRPVLQGAGSWAYLWH